jgi:hypothetical protein
MQGSITSSSLITHSFRPYCLLASFLIATSYLSFFCADITCVGMAFVVLAYLGYTCKMMQYDAD